MKKLVIRILTIALVISITNFALAGDSMKSTEGHYSSEIMIPPILAQLSGRFSGGHVWGHGNTRRQACSNAKARARMSCENPVLGNCECSTFDPRSKWTCNVSFSCR